MASNTGGESSCSKAAISKGILTNNSGEVGLVDEDELELNVYNTEIASTFFSSITRDNPLSMKEAGGIAAMISNRFESFTPQIITQQLRISPVGRISEPICLALCHLALNKPGEVGNDLRKAENLMKQASEDGLISSDYFQGLEHLLNDVGTKDFGKHQDGICEPISEPFQELSQSARAVIMAVHAVFAGCRRQTEVEIELLQCINKIDPKNIEWPLRLHIALRTSRNDKSFRGKPCPEEKEALRRAIHLNRDHISVKLQSCMYLSDVIRHHSLESPKWGLDLVLEGYVELYSLETGVEHIKNMCNEILMTEDGSNWLMANLTIADINGFALPFKYRDIELALKCLRNALEINPKSSKANHKMGILLLSSAGESEKALQYIRKAFANNHTNVAALMDIIQILLSSPEENSSELEALFEKYVVRNGRQWPAFRLVSLLFTKGIYHFIKAEKEAALQTWMEVFKTDSKSLEAHFKKLPRLCSRYNWDSRRLSLRNILDSMEAVRQERRESPGMDDEYVISLLIMLVKGAQEKPSIYQGDGGGNEKRQANPSYTSRAQHCISDAVDNWRNGQETRESNSSWRKLCCADSDPAATRRNSGRRSKLSDWGAIGEKSWRD